MKLYSSKGIIFRTLKYSETSIICDIYTREKGLRSFIVSGVRSSKAGSKAAIYHHLNMVELVSYDQDPDKLSRISEIRLLHHYQMINTQVVISSIAIFLLEVCRQSIKEREANPELFDFLENWFLYLDQKNNYHSCGHMLFLLELSHELGFGPMNNYHTSTAYFEMMEGSFTSTPAPEYSLNLDESQALSTLLKTQRHDLHTISIPKSVRDSLTNQLVLYYRLHISDFRELHSLEVLRAVL